MTRALRRSPWWASFRAELAARGLKPDELMLIDAFDDDEGIDVGLLATSEQRLIAWRRAYDDDHSTSRILEWHDVTDSWATTLWAEEAAAYVEALKHTRSR